MGRKNKKVIVMKVKATDPGLGFSPYQQTKGMGYSPTVRDETKRDRKRAKHHTRDNRRWED